MKLESRLVDNEYRRDVITIGLASGIPPKNRNTNMEGSWYWGFIDLGSEMEPSRMRGIKFEKSQRSEEKLNLYMRI